MDNQQNLTMNEEAISALKALAQQTTSFRLNKSLRQISHNTGVAAGTLKSAYYRLKQKPPYVLPEHTVPEVTGNTLTAQTTDFKKDTLPGLIALSKKVKDKRGLEQNASIIMDANKPFAVAVMGDVHMGGEVDYEKLVSDIELIRDTPDMHCILNGDLSDNFIYRGTTAILMQQNVTLTQEHEALKWMLDNLRSKIVAVTVGNHDAWTKKVAGFDPIATMLQGVTCLYGNNRVVFDLVWGDNKQKWLVQHQWRYSSIFNTTHSIEVGWERIQIPFDVGVGGHTHVGTFCRPFIKAGKRRYAIQVGTYKHSDSYGRELGFADTPADSFGSGAMVYYPDGRVQWFDDLRTAKDFLKFLQIKY